MRLFHKLVLYSFFVFIDCVAVSQNIDTLKISGSYFTIPLTEFLHELENEIPVTFYYKNEWFEGEIISLTYFNLPLTQVLDEAIKDKPYIFKVVQGDMIVFLPKEDVAFMVGDMVRSGNNIEDESVFVIGDPNEAGTYKQVTLKGYVKDGKTGEPLIGATIQIGNTMDGVITNSTGEYSLLLKPGIYTLNIVSIGFEKTVRKIKITSNGELDFELFSKSVKLDEIVVYAQRSDRNIQSNQMSIVELDSREIKQLPSITGEKDILKSLTMMPGIKSIGEFGSGINVRGGSEDQNLYIIEGAPIFNTAHVFGLQSVLNSDIVNSVILYKGHIPAEYGERVSSVMEIQVKNGSEEKKIRSKGGIGLYNSRLMIEGPIYKENVSFKLGGRCSYSDYLLSQFQDYQLQVSSASFYDMNALLNINLKNNRITLFGYRSYDKFKDGTSKAYEYGNELVSLSWRHSFNSSLGSSFLASNSRYAVIKDEYTPYFEESRFKSKIIYSTVKFNFMYTGITGHNITTGLQAIYYNINPGQISPLYDSTILTKVKLKHEQASENAFYINDVFDINESISVNAGIRFSGYFYLGARTMPVYSPDLPVSETSAIDSVVYGNGEIIKSYYGLEPRVSLKYLLNDKSSVKLSYNRNNQYISLISYTAIPTPDDVWKLSDSYLKPVISDQLALGYYRNFFNDRIEVSAEVYYKTLKNLREYKNNARLSMNQNIETELIDASGKNYGIEFIIKKNRGKLDGWLSYTYSKSFIKTDGKFIEDKINNNQYYRSSFDKPHDLTLFATYHINRRWRVSGNFRFSSGRPVTLPEYKYTSLGNELIYYSDRNKYTLPFYHRLDLSVSFDEPLRLKKKWKGSWSFSILNVYGRKNAYSVFYKKEQPGIQNDYESFNLYKLYIIGRPLPTITYNFIF